MKKDLKIISIILVILFFLAIFLFFLKTAENYKTVVTTKPSTSKVVSRPSTVVTTKPSTSKVVNRPSTVVTTKPSTVSSKSVFITTPASKTNMVLPLLTPVPTKQSISRPSRNIRNITNIIPKVTEKPAITSKTCDDLSRCPTIPPPPFNSAFSKDDLTGYWYLQVKDWTLYDFTEVTSQRINVSYAGNVYLMPDDFGNDGGYKNETFFKKFWSILPLDPSNPLPGNPYGTGKWGIKIATPTYYAFSVGRYPGDSGMITPISPTQLKVDETTFMKRLYKDTDGTLKMYNS